MRIKTLSAPSLLSLDSLCFILKSRPADGSLTLPDLRLDTAADQSDVFFSIFLPDKTPCWVS